MIFYELKDNEGFILASTISSCSEGIVFVGQEEKNLKNKLLRNVYRKTRNGSVRLVIFKEKDLMNSSRLVSNKIDIYTDTIDILIKIKADQASLYKILFHNLITTHASLQGEVGSIVKEEDMMGSLNYKEQINVIEKNIKLNTKSASESMLEISKGINAFQAQIQGIKMLRSDIRLDLGLHSIKKLLLNIIYPFYNEYNKRNIDIKINIDDDLSDGNKLKIDYKIFNVAMHHFLNNISKYTKPYSKVDIRFNFTGNSLEFTMESAKIEKDEILTIFELGVSGKNVRNLAGDGVGMYMVKKALDLHGYRMEVIPSYSTKTEYDGVDYTKNKFIIYFNNKSY